MCGSSGSTVSSTSGPPQQFLQAYTDVYNTAKGLTGQPYQQYTGPMVAGFSPDQLAAFGTIQNSQGIAQPYYNQAASYFGSSADPLSPMSFGSVDPGMLADLGLGYFDWAGQAAAAATQPIDMMDYDIDPYWNEYTTHVTNALSDLYAQNNAEQYASAAGNAAAQGAYGSDREALLSSEMARQQKLAQDPTLAQVQQQGFAQAQQEFNDQQKADLQRQLAERQYALSAGQLGLGIGQGMWGEFNTQQAQDMQAQQASAYLQQAAGYGIANLGQLAQNTALAGANAQLGIGGMEQQLSQQNLNIPYYQFMAQQAYPYQQTGWLSNIATGLGGASGGTASTTYPGPSTLGQVAGLGTAALGLYNAWPSSSSGSSVIPGSGGITNATWDSAFAGWADGGPVGRATGGRVGLAMGGVPPEFGGSAIPGGSADSFSYIPGAHGLGAQPASPQGSGMSKMFMQPQTTQTQSGGGGGGGLLGALGTAVGFATGMPWLGAVAGGIGKVAGIADGGGIGLADGGYADGGGAVPRGTGLADGGDPAWLDWLGVAEPATRSIYSRPSYGENDRFLGDPVGREAGMAALREEYRNHPDWQTGGRDGALNNAISGVAIKDYLNSFMPWTEGYQRDPNWQDRQPAPALNAEVYVRSLPEMSRGGASHYAGGGATGHPAAPIVADLTHVAAPSSFGPANPNAIMPAYNFSPSFDAQGYPGAMTQTSAGAPVPPPLSIPMSNGMFNRAALGSPPPMPNLPQVPDLGMPTVPNMPFLDMGAGDIGQGGANGGHFGSGFAEGGPVPMRPMPAESLEDQIKRLGLDQLRSLDSPAGTMGRSTFSDLAKRPGATLRDAGGSVMGGSGMGGLSYIPSGGQMRAPAFGPPKPPTMPGGKPPDNGMQSMLDMLKQARTTLSSMGENDGGAVAPATGGLGFDDGGSVGAGGGQMQQNALLQQYQNLPIEKLRELAMQYPATTPQGQALQRAMQMKSMMGAGSGPSGPHGAAGTVYPGTTAADGGGMGLGEMMPLRNGGTPDDDWIEPPPKGWKPGDPIDRPAPPTHGLAAGGDPEDLFGPDTSDLKVVDITKPDYAPKQPIGGLSLPLDGPTISPLDIPIPSAKGLGAPTRPSGPLSAGDVTTKFGGPKTQKLADGTLVSEDDFPYPYAGPETGASALRDPLSVPQINGPPSNPEIVPRGTAPGQLAPRSASGPERDQVVEFWVNNGVPQHVAEGIADRVNAESGFKTGIMGDNGTSGGPYQHHNERLAALKAFAAKQGLPWTAPGVANQFALSEVLGGDAIAAAHWEEIKNAPDRQTAAMLWDKYFERSKYGPGSGGAGPGVGKGITLASGIKPGYTAEGAAPDRVINEAPKAGGLSQALETYTPKEKTDIQKMMSSPWMMLVNAGAGMLASRSPYPGVALGEGLQAATKGAAQQADRENKEELTDIKSKSSEVQAQNLVDKANQARAALDEKAGHNRQTEFQASQNASLREQQLQQQASAAAAQLELKQQVARSQDEARKAREEYDRTMAEIRKQMADTQAAKQKAEESKGEWRYGMGPDPKDPSKQVTGSWFYPKTPDPSAPNRGVVFEPYAGTAKETAVNSREAGIVDIMKTQGVDRLGAERLLSEAKRDPKTFQNSATYQRAIQSAVRDMGQDPTTMTLSQAQKELRARKMVDERYGLTLPATGGARPAAPGAAPAAAAPATVPQERVQNGWRYKLDGTPIGPVQ